MTDNSTDDRSDEVGASARTRSATALLPPPTTLPPTTLPPTTDVPTTPVPTTLAPEDEPITTGGRPEAGSDALPSQRTLFPEIDGQTPLDPPTPTCAAADLRVHPICNTFPEMTEEEFADLKKDISLNGLQQPLLVHNGQIVDGRHRWRACQDLGIDAPATEEWDGRGELVDIVASLNLHRRHLNAGQRAAIAAELLPHFKAAAKDRQRTHGGTSPGRRSGASPRSGRSDSGKAAAHAARVLGASRTCVERAGKLLAEDSEAFRDVKRGKVSLNAAYRRIRRPEGSEKPTELEEPKEPVERKELKSPGARFVLSRVRLAAAKPSSVDLVFWVGGALGDLCGAGTNAHRALRPDGRMIAVVRPDELPRALEQLRAPMMVRWALTLFASDPGASISVPGRGVATAWMPGFWLTPSRAEDEGLDPPVDTLHGVLEVHDGKYRVSGEGLVIALNRLARPGDVVCVEGDEGLRGRSARVVSA